MAEAGRWFCLPPGLPENVPIRPRRPQAGPVKTQALLSNRPARPGRTSRREAHVLTCGVGADCGARPIAHKNQTRSS